MNRLPSTTARPLLILAIVFGIQVLLLAIDLQTPLGYGFYIPYFLTIALSLLSRTPWMSVASCLTASAFTFAGYKLSPRGIDPSIAFVNRSMTVFSFFCVTALVFQVMRSRNTIDAERTLKGHITSLTERIRGEMSVESIAESTLLFMAETFGVKVGTFYALNAQDKSGSLRRLATYATDESEAASPLVIKLGQGQLGQAALENRVKTIGRPQQSHLKVRSSLGEALIAPLVLAPITADKEVQGMLELGFLGEPTADLYRFLEESAENVGIALRSAFHKNRLAGLLAESTLQSERLQVQQEELRVNNEELESQSRALKESQTNLENQQAELEQLNQQLEEQAKSLQGQKGILEERNLHLENLQKTLRDKALELERANQYKSEFLANMSHELRTPLNSSLILAKLLADNKAGNLSAEQIKYAETIYASGNDLLNLINDILDLAKVEAGRIDLNVEPVSIDALLVSLERVFKPMAEQKKLSLVLERDPAATREIKTDRTRLEQVLKNFMSNALKFTSEGEVSLRVLPAVEGVEFAIEDTGIGIPEHQHEVIFEAFRQADGTTSRKFGGTGLGLSISRELAHLLGGTIRVRSEVGMGSVFTLWMPLEYKSKNVSSQADQRGESRQAPRPEANPQAPYAKSAATAAMANGRSGNSAGKGGGKPAKKSAITDDREITDATSRKILIVEDDETFAKILLDTAREMHFHAIVAHTGGEGVELAERYLPNAVILDIRLPDHSGLGVLDQLKSNPRTRHIPVHIMSSEDFTKTALEMGAAGYMVKPVKHGQLVKAFTDLEEKMSQRIKKALIVEDDETQRESMTSLIADPEVKVTAAASAAEALERLSKETFDCMVMDLSLPDMSGFDLLEKIASGDSPYSYPPVIVYTGRDLTREDEEKLRRYSGSIVIKGARSPERLLNEVTLFLHRVESQLPPERQKMLKDLRGREKSLADRTILLVDDDVRNVFALGSALESEGALVEIARNGREALEQLERLPKVDLVLMDIMMPEMDGYEATRRIRQQERWAKLPVIAVTAKAMKDDQERCIEAGASDYLAKPVDIDKLISLVRVWLPPNQGFWNGYAQRDL